MANNIISEADFLASLEKGEIQEQPTNEFSKTPYSAARAARLQ